MFNQEVTGTLTFNPEDIKSGKLMKFVEILVALKCEVRLWTSVDGYCTVEYIDSEKREEGYEFLLAYSENDIEDMEEK